MHARSLSFLLFIGFFFQLQAVTYEVTSTSNGTAIGTLRSACSLASNGDLIVFLLPPSSVISLSGDPIILSVSCTIDGTIDGGNVTISGDGATRPFFVSAGTPSLQNMTLDGGYALGGTGGNSNLGGAGGGGAGMGGACFVGSSIEFQNVLFTNNTAEGGLGGSTFTAFAKGGAGGGGMGGAAGGAIQGLGSNGGGSGGGGRFPSDSGGNAIGDSGGVGGASGGGNGGDVENTGNSGTTWGGGGGAGSSILTSPLAGGAGGFGGGGGGEGSGMGVLGGGGGNGGFGGGGGATAADTSSAEGTGGFGAGNGGAAALTFQGAGGGGGAGLGGALFITSGNTATLIYDSSLTAFDGNSSQGGVAGVGNESTPATNGEGLGTEIFIQSGASLIFQIDNADTEIALPGTIVSNGNGQITKTGTGILDLFGANDYTGGTTFSLGQINMNNDSALGSGTISMADGTILSLGATITASNPISIANSAVGTFLVDVGPATVSGNLASTSGILTKTGAGTLTLSGNNQHSGGTLLENGQITLSHNSGLGTGTLTMSDATTLSLGSGISASNAISINAASTGSCNVSSGTATLSGNLANTSGVLAKTGAGTLVLSGNNQYSGGTLLTAGQITLNHNSGLGTGTLSFSDATTLSLSPSISASNPFSIANGTSATLNVSSGTGTLSGNFASTTGELIKEGSGTLALSGNNGYSGGTLLNAGQITVNHNNAMGSGAVTMEAGTLLSLGANIVAPNNLIASATGTRTLHVPSGTATLSGGLQGSTGNFAKTGSGVLRLSGTSTYTGLMSVAAGEFIVNGSFAGNVGAASGTTIRGTGTISGTLTLSAGSFLSPGNSIGTLTVGTLDLDDDATTYIEFDPTDASLIVVTGTANLGGEVHLTQNEGSYAPTATYQIIDAGAVNGTFSGITGGLSGYSFGFLYSDTAVFFQYTRGGSSSTIHTRGLKGNELKFAEYLNQYAPRSSEYEALAALSGASLQEALTSVSPARNAMASFVSCQTLLSISRTGTNYSANRRMFQNTPLGQPMSASLPKTQEWIAAKELPPGSLAPKERNASPFSTWLGGFGEMGKQAKEDQNPSFSFHAEGALLGLTYQNRADAFLGGAIGYAHSHLDNAIGEASTPYYLAMLYANVECGSFYFQPSLLASFHQTKSSRSIAYANVNATAQGKHDGWQLDPHLEIGYDHLFSWGKVEPFVAVDWVIDWERPFEEKGASHLNMRQPSQTSSILQSELGLRLYQLVERSWGSFGFQEKGSYLYRNPFETGTVTTAIVGASNFVSLPSFTQSEHLGAFQLGFFAQCGDQRDWLFSCTYEGQFGSGSVFNELFGQISKQF